MYDLSKVVVTSSPHIKAGDDTRSLMLDVLIALLPALCVAVYTFGWRALVLTVISMVACAVFETIYNHRRSDRVQRAGIRPVVDGCVRRAVRHHHRQDAVRRHR